MPIIAPAHFLREPHMPQTALHLELANDPAELARLVAEVAQWMEPLNPTPRAQFVMDLVVEEMVLNVIKHAFDVEGRHTFTVDISEKDRVAFVRIEDDGKPFDPVQATEPDLTLPLEQRPIGGLGIHLVRKMAQGMEYVRAGEKNILTVRVGLDTTA